MPARLRVTRRAYFLTFETNLTGLWALPPRRRVGPLLAGTGFDAFVLCAALALRAAGVGPDAFLAAVVMIELTAVVVQLFVFLRSDVYAVMTALLGCTSLDRTTRLLLRRSVGRLTAEQAVKLADARYTVDDVVFMRDMIHHHDQAVQMAELVKDRTNLPETVAVAGRINSSQADEIAFMQKWLRERGESVPDPSMHRGMDMKGTMVGMASPADMAKLATLKGADFDRLFLTLMIAHHDGALKMVDALVKKPGSAYDPVLYQFTSDVKLGQKAEIARMTGENDEAVASNHQTAGRLGELSTALQGSVARFRAA